MGIPLGAIYALDKAKVPALAAWKRDCAWLRAIVQRAARLGVVPQNDFDPDTITTESVSLEHLQLLHALFVASQHAKAEGMPQLPPELAAQQQQQGGRAAGERQSAEGHVVPKNTLKHLGTAHQGLTVRQMLDAVHAAAVAEPVEEPAPKADAPSGSGNGQHASEPVNGVRARTRPLALQASGAMPAPVTRRMQDVVASPPTAGVTRRGSVALLRRASEKQGLPANAWAAAFVRLGRRLKELTHARARSVRRALSSIMFSSEREQLLGALLEWARHNRESMVAEPRANVMRWRTVYEWEALRAAAVNLGNRDTAERAAFSKFNCAHLLGCRLLLSRMCVRSRAAACIRSPLLQLRGARMVRRAACHMCLLSVAKPDATCPTGFGRVWI